MAEKIGLQFGGISDRAEIAATPMTGAGAQLAMQTSRYQAGRLNRNLRIAVRPMIAMIAKVPLRGMASGGVCVCSKTFALGSPTTRLTRASGTD